MTPYTNILLAADLVERDDHPVSQKAVALAKASNAKLSVIHVVEQPYYYGIPYENPSLDIWMQEMEQTVKGEFEKLAESLSIPPDQRHFINGQAKIKILEIAKKIKADLIILGSHGRHGIGLLLMGSTASAVLHESQCDVLAVRVVHQPPKKH